MGTAILSSTPHPVPPHVGGARSLSPAKLWAMKAKIAGSEIAYEVAGDGPAVLFLHAFPLALAMWDDQAAALRATHRVVRFDNRGFGASPPADSLLTMERIADDGAALLDHLGLERAVVAGCSMGGYAAFAMVRRHVDRIRALVLQDTRAGADTEDAGRTARCSPRRP